MKDCKGNKFVVGDKLATVKRPNKPFIIYVGLEKGMAKFQWIGLKDTFRIKEESMSSSDWIVFCNTKGG